jgi:sodium/potassium-transporting ATPase subunit alpha
MRDLLAVSLINQRAKYNRTDIPLDQRQIIGDATESGLLLFASTRLNNIDRLPELYPVIFEVPFTSDSKMQMTIHRKSHSNGGITLHAKGAPEVLWKLCRL